MSEKSDKTTIQQLEQFGLSNDEAVIYIYLINKGNKTALSLSRDLKMPRTRVYRNLDNLIEKGFVYEIIEERGRRFQAAGIDRFSQFINFKKQEVDSLSTLLPSLQESLLAIQLESSHQSKIINFRGIEGIEQINWNSTKTKDTLRIFEQAQQIENWIPHNKAERLREEFHDNNVTVHQLTNSTDIPDYTKVVGHVEDCTVRYIPPKTLTLQSDLIIYENIIASYSKNDSDYFGVEIHDITISSILKQMFDHFWNIAQPMEKISKYGAARLQK